MRQNPSNRFNSIDFSKVISFDYVLSTPPETTKPTDQTKLSLSTLSLFQKNPELYIDNCNIHNPSLYHKEYSKLKGCVIVCLSEIKEPVLFQKIVSLARDTGTVFISLNY
jgi:hypothetical protein